MDTHRRARRHPGFWQAASCTILVAAMAAFCHGFDRGGCIGLSIGVIFWVESILAETLNGLDRLREDLERFSHREGRRHG